MADEARTGRDGQPAVRLGARGVSRRFGTVLANQAIDLSVGAGTIHAVVGGNGAGKTTLMRLLQGLDQPDEGTIIVSDEPVRLADPSDAFARGIGMVHQEFMLVGELTLLENLILGKEPVGFAGIIDLAAAEKSAREIAAAAGVALDWHIRAADAPVHTRQIVEILRLIYRGADILILDEPTAVLAPAQVRELFNIMRRLKSEGRTILFISHKLSEVLSVADRITVLRQGKVVATTMPAETDAARLATLMIGGSIDTVTPGERRPVAARTGLSVRGLVVRDRRGIERLRGIDLDISGGEIVGIAAVAGNGQDELALTVAGLITPSRGELLLDGESIGTLSIAERRRAGVAYVSADRAVEGLSLDASIRDNFIAGRHRATEFAPGGVLRPARIAAHVTNALDRFSIVYGGIGDRVRKLSGGNQQRVVIAREFDGSPRLLVATQPTRGVDIRGTAFIHQQILAFRDRGGVVLLVSEDLDELIMLSDRIVVLYDGRIAGEVGQGADADRVGRLMLGQVAA
jgi:simple sugar transport system ATP-binding protein